MHYPTIKLNKNIKHIIAFVIALVICFIVSTGAFYAHAAAVRHEAKITSVKPEKTIITAPGKTIDIQIGFENTGTTTFVNTKNGNFTALNTEFGLSKKSVFQHSSWPEYWRPGYIEDTEVKPGGKSIVKFTIQAPAKEGTYQESFRLATKNVGLVDGTTFTLKVIVDKKQAETTTTPAPTTTTSGTAPIVIPANTNNAPLSVGIFAVKPDKTINLTPGMTTTVEVWFQNNGTTTLQKSGSNFAAVNTEYGKAQKSILQHSSWPEYWRPGYIEDTEVKPGVKSLAKFTIQAPDKLGTYVEAFRMAVKNVGWIDHSEFKLTINVITPEQFKTLPTPTTTPSVPTSTPTTNTPTVPTTPSVVTTRPDQVTGSVYVDERPTSTPTPTPTQTPTTPTTPSTSDTPIITDYGNLITRLPIRAEDIANSPAINLMEQHGPRIRVGLYKTTGSINVRGLDTVQVRDSDNNLVQEIPANQTITLEYKDSNYNVATAGFIQSSLKPYHLVIPLRGIMEITSLTNKNTWNPSTNDNKFRDTLELRYSEKDGTIWVINELPMEFYLKGMAETSPGSPAEYTKAMVIAARSYALYHSMLNTKHRNRYFHVTSTESDQVYRGYNIEQRYPELTQYVDATRGVIATYNNEVAVIPYYSKSDGRTRTWTEVWGNAGTMFGYANIKKDIPWDKERTLLGHGVGISAYAARDMDKYHNAHALEIINYFFDGLQFTRWY